MSVHKEAKKRATKTAKTTRKPRAKARPKTRGAPKGNQNARKHGLWSSLFTDSEITEIARYPNPSVDDILPLLLVRIGRAVDQGDSLDSISRGIDTFLRALKVQFALSGDQADTWAQALALALDQTADELELPQL